MAVRRLTRRWRSPALYLCHMASERSEVRYERVCVGQSALVLSGCCSSVLTAKETTSVCQQAAETLHILCVFNVIMNQTCDHAPSAAKSKKKHDN